MRRTKSGTIWQWIAAAAVLGTVVGCTGTSGDGKTADGKTAEGKSGDKITIYLLPKTTALPYFTSCSKGAKEAEAELGDVDVIYDGPSDGKAEKAAGLIEQWTLKKADAIAVSPDDPEVLSTAMKKAMDAGVKVVTWDAGTPKENRLFHVNQADPKDIGYALVDAMVKDLGGPSASGELAIVTASMTAKNQNDWIVSIKERLKEYPNLSIVAIKAPGEDQLKARSVTQDLMKAYPNLKGVFAISSSGFPGAAEAIQQAGMSGKIMVTGLATPNDIRKYVEDGTVKSVILWNTEDLGYLTIQVARAVVKGELKVGDTKFKAGRLGEVDVVGDNVMLGKILVFTKDNIGKYNF